MSFALVLLSVWMGAQAPAPKRVFVTRFAANAVSEENVRVVQGLVVDELARMPGLRVTSYLDVVNALTQEQARQLVDCTQTGCALDVAGTLDADEYVTGGLGLLGEQYVLSLTRQDGRSGAVLRRASVQFRHLESVGKRLPRVVAELFDVPWAAALDEDLEPSATEDTTPPSQTQPARAPRANRGLRGASMWLALLPPAAATLPCLVVLPSVLLGSLGVCEAGYVAADSNPQHQNQVPLYCGAGCACCAAGCGSWAVATGLLVMGGVTVFQTALRRYAVPLTLGIVAGWALGMAATHALVGVMVGGFFSSGADSVQSGVGLALLAGGPLLGAGGVFLVAALGLALSGTVGALITLAQSNTPPNAPAEDD